MSSEDAKPVNGSAIAKKTPVSRLSMNNNQLNGLFTEFMPFNPYFFCF
ncbi:hypothetical protein [Microcystis aeruginosa]|nr:hypothetical protein [Microcystis aeruginosa]